MSTLRRWLLRLLLLVLAPLLLLAAVWTYGRLTSPTEAQRTAVALMEAHTPGEGENGYPLMMALPPGLGGGLPEALRCAQPAACLDAFASDPEGSAAAIEASRARLEAAARALHAPVFRALDGFGTPGVDDLPPFEPVMSLGALRAWTFSTGQTAEALDALCTDTLGAVRWAADADSLITGMIGIAALRRNAGLIAEMRRRAPDDPLPASCGPLAEAPDPALEGTLCPALRGEWRYQRRLFPELERQMAASAEGDWLRPIAPLLHSTDWQLARSAEHFASACSDEARRAALEDRAFGLSAPPIRWVDRVAFANSAVLVDIALPAYAGYAERQLDFVAMRRLLAALLQMEVMDAALDPAQRFAALPAALREGPRPLRLEADAEGWPVLAVALRSPRSLMEETEARLPLPARNAGSPPGP